MAEEKKKQSEEQLQEEQLDEVSGGRVGSDSNQQAGLQFDLQTR